MDINSINAMNANQAETIVNKSAKLGQDDFLKLLAVQMQNQNPLDPVDDKSFIAQLAQISSLEQMQNINNNMSMSQAVSMMGKNIIALTTLSDGTQWQIAGTVGSIKFINGQVMLNVEGLDIPLSDVLEVSDSDE